MSMRDTILAEIDEFLAKTGMSATRFGKSINNDPNLVHRLRSGERSIILETADKIRAFIATYENGKDAGSSDDDSGSSDIKAMEAVL